jgi:hypothetical protein
VTPLQFKCVSQVLVWCCMTCWFIVIQLGLEGCDLCLAAAGCTCLSDNLLPLQLHKEHLLAW